MIKKSVLELGGSDAFVVMPSANLDAAVKTAVTARTSTTASPASRRSASSCTTPSTTSSCSAFVDRMAALQVGDPMDAATDVGPLATASELAKLAEQVDAAVKDGARLAPRREAAPAARATSTRRRCSADPDGARRPTARRSSARSR